MGRFQACCEVLILVVALPLSARDKVLIAAFNYPPIVDPVVNT